jgi:hypothetical protein
MPRVTDSSYPSFGAGDLDDDDVALIVKDNEVGRADRAAMRDWLRTDAAIRTLIGQTLVPGNGVQITPDGATLTLTINVNIGGGEDIEWINGAGPVVTAPNGTKYRLGVSNAGALTLTALGAVATTPKTGFATGTVWSTPLSTDHNLMSSIAPAGFVRSDFSWKVVQPNNAGEFIWTTYDARIAATNAVGMKTLAMLGYSPGWANGGNTLDDKFPPAVGFTDEWQEYCRRFAERYIPQGVRHFELWNEPNLQRFWKPAPNVADYVNRVLIPGAAGLRAAATAAGVTITVITAGTAPALNGTNVDPRTWYTGVYSNGGKNHFDAIGHHPYTWPFPPGQDSHIPPGSFSPNQWNTMIQTLAIRQTMLTNTDGAKKIWATEVGAPSRDAAPTYPTTGHQNFVSHTTLATRINEITDYWYALPSGSDLGWAGPIIWYQHRNQSAEPLGTNTEGGFGIVYNSGTDKPNGVRAALTAKFAQYA